MCSGGLQAAGFRRAKARRYTNFLLRVEFDDELFLDRQTDVFPFWKIEHGAEELFRIQLQPGWNAAAAGRLDGLADLVILAALLANLNDFALAHLVRGDVVLPSIHLDVSVPDELPRLRARRRESERVDDVVETQLELAKKHFAGDAFLCCGAREVEPELALQQAINALDLLLLAKLQSVAENLGAAPAVLAGRVIAALVGALVLETAVPFEEQLHALTPAQPANGI